MSQKIYTDRTELEGVDLPSAGQTKLLVIDENKKIKSEEKAADLQGKYIDVVLDKGEINTLHTTPVTITSTDLGLAVGQYVKIMINSCEVKVNSDGVDFSSTRPIFLTYTTPTPNAEILKFDYTNYSGANKDGYYSFTNAGSGFLSQAYKLDNSYQLNVGEEITGGGVNATITFRIYYHIVDSW